MKVTYAPKGADPVVWDFDPDEVTQSQAETDREAVRRPLGRLH
jgi:hypothetical protein